MSLARKPFSHAGADARREALIAAALACIAEGGAEGATVRAIALRAGVTPGLIRHYFPSKEALLQAAYERLMAAMTDAAEAALDGPPTARARLDAFVAASLAPPVIDPARLAAWAGFIGRVGAEPAMRATHRAGYRRFRDRLAALIAEALAEAGRPAAPAALEALAIEVNALIDGLWLEGSLLAEDFPPGTLAALGTRATAALLDLAPEPL